METITELSSDRNLVEAPISKTSGRRRYPPRRHSRRVLTLYAFLGGMVITILLLDAVLPLRDFWFHEATLTQLGVWPVWPSLLVFRYWALITPLTFVRPIGTPSVALSWAIFPALMGAFAIVFLTYFAAIRQLPRRITWRFLFRSTIVLGIFFVLIPAVTSPDLYSYIAYARMGVIYNLNPLTTLPTAIRADPVYTYVMWVDQPSAYGPTWAILTSFIQWTIVHLGNSYILPMVLSLRLLGLASHLISTRLVWSITGQLQQLRGYAAPYPSRKRLRATLAFAWNPLLLFEACTNAHNDAVMLVFLLLVIWILAQGRIVARGLPLLSIFTHSLPTSPKGDREGRPYKDTNRVSTGLVVFVRATLAVALRGGARGKAVVVDAYRTFIALPMQRLIARIPTDLRTPIAAASLLGIATCLKINLVLLFPGLLYYLWLQAPDGKHLRHGITATLSYIGTIVLLYAPFWQGGGIFYVFRVNPATYRTANTVTDTLAHLYNSIASLFGFPMGAPIGSPAERFLHTVSMGIFAIIYVFMLWRMIHNPQRMRTLYGLISWLTVAWLLYCAIGSPWFWPWYLVTFFGLFALLEGVGNEEERETTAQETTLFPWSFSPLRTPWTTRLLAFSMLSAYCFITWGPLHSFIPGLPEFQWSYLGGLWAWLLPLAGGAYIARRWRFLTR
jgi:hypothetical protein